LRRNGFFFIVTYIIPEKNIAVVNTRLLIYIYDVIEYPSSVYVCACEQEKEETIDVEYIQAREGLLHVICKEYLISSIYTYTHKK